jgi:hypothetical protein
MDPSVPRRAPRLLEEDLDEEIVILQGDRDEIHVLNETAAEIWRRVDGVRDRAAIVAAFAEPYRDVDPADLARDVDGVLDDLAAKGLLEPD